MTTPEVAGKLISALECVAAGEEDWRIEFVSHAGAKGKQEVAILILNEAAAQILKRLCPGLGRFLNRDRG